MLSKLYFPARIRTGPRRLTATLVIIALALLVANLMAIYSTIILNHPYSFAWRFYFDKRLNIPFFFSLILLSLNVWFVHCILKEKNGHPSETVFWRIFGLLFLFFGIDESFNLHNRFKAITYGTIASYNPASLLHYLWVIPYFAVFGFLMLQLKKHAADIPEYLKKGLMTASVLFVFGAVLMEFAGTYYYVVTRKTDIYLLLIKTVEELFQIIGLIVFIYYISEYYGKLKRARTFKSQPVR